MNEDSNELPDWVVEMTNEEWEAFKEKVRKEQESLNEKFNVTHKPKVPYTNCAKCGKRLIITLCNQEEEKHYCETCCPEHKWQSDYDWSTECARCGITYVGYLENMLVQHNVAFLKN